MHLGPLTLRIHNASARALLRAYLEREKEGEGEEEEDKSARAGISLTHRAGYRSSWTAGFFTLQRMCIVTYCWLGIFFFFIGNL